MDGNIAATFRRGAAFWLAPGLLIVIALVQLARVHMGTLTPWKGGGFGMFSSFEGPDSRFIKVYLLTKGGELPTRLPQGFEREVTFACTEPDQRQLKSIALELTLFYWFKGHGTWPDLSSIDNRAKYKQPDGVTDILAVHHPEALYQTHEIIDVQSIRVEMWRTRLDPNGAVLRTELWMASTVPLGRAKT